MKRIFPLLLGMLAACLTACTGPSDIISAPPSASAAPTFAASAAPDSAQYRFEISSEEIRIDCRFPDAAPTPGADGSATLKVEGMQDTYQPYALPVKGFTLALPPGTAVDSVQVQRADTRSDPNITFKEQSYGTTAQGQGGVITTSGATTAYTLQQKAGISLTMLQVSPAAYDPAAKTLEYARTVTVRIALKKAPLPQGGVDKDEAALVQGLVDNPQTVDEYLK